MRKILFLGGLLFLAACQQNPFPADFGIHTAPKPPAPVPVPPPPPGLPAYAIDAPQVMEFTEDAESSYTIRTTVPEPGKAKVTFKDLPAGVTYDPVKGVLSWKPAYDAANDPKKPGIVTRQYKVTVLLQSDADPITQVQKDILLVVADKPRDFTLSTPAAVTLTEGTAHKQDIKVSDLDFPDGPFTVVVEGLPATAEFKTDMLDGTHFVVQYTPLHDTVNLLKTRTVEYNLTIKAQNPRGRVIEMPAKWTVVDERLEPLVSAPTQVTQGTQGTFSFVATDANGEENPKVTLINKPSYGVLEVTTAPGFRSLSGEKSEFVNVSWKEVPPTKFGTSEVLNFNVCAYRTRTSKDLCVKRAVTVNFSGETHPRPLIDRSKWTAGNIEYILEAETLKRALPIKDASAGGAIPKVEILPASMQSEVSWGSHWLTVTPKTPGLKQFDVVATSEFGIQSVESFVFEALPVNWSPVLVLIDSPLQPEAMQTAALFGGVQFLNPLLQPLDKRALAKRSTLVVTTGSIQPNALNSISDAVAALPNVWISTPLVQSLSTTVAELDGLGLQMENRFLDSATPAPSLMAFNVLPVQGTALTSPRLPVRLSETLTAESKSPRIMSLKPDSKCVGLLNLHQDTPLTDHLIAASCHRANGGRLVVSGIEWGTLTPDTSELGLPKQWITEILQ